MEPEAGPELGRVPNGVPLATAVLPIERTSNSKLSPNTKGTDRIVGVDHHGAGRREPAVATFLGEKIVRGAFAQEADPKLLREAEAVRTVLAANKAALSAYTWTERTEVLVDGKLHSTTEMLCRYDPQGEVARTPKEEAAAEGKKASAMSNKPRVREKAAKQDYIERTISLIRYYVPPNPDRITAMLQNGTASLGKSEAGKSGDPVPALFHGGRLDGIQIRYDLEGSGPRFHQSGVGG
ncbi:MAG: hypothetical protein ABI806_30115 [Candidatus Solibacter sp.]